MFADLLSAAPRAQPQKVETDRKTGAADFSAVALPIYIYIWSYR